MPGALIPEAELTLVVTVQQAMYETQAEWREAGAAFNTLLSETWKKATPALKAKYGKNWQTFRKVHGDAWKAANPKPKPSPDEDAFLQRCGECLAKINAMRTYSLKGEGERKNEWNYVQKLVKEFDDPNFERIERIRNYLYNDDYRYRGAKRQRIGAYEIYSEAAAVLLELAERERSGVTSKNGHASHGKSRPPEPTDFTSKTLDVERNERNLARLLEQSRQKRAQRGEPPIQAVAASSTRGSPPWNNWVRQ